MVGCQYQLKSEIQLLLDILKRLEKCHPIFFRKWITPSDVAHHSYDDRIRSHLLICWLALLLVRIAEVETAMCWAVVRRTMPRLHFGEFLNEKYRFLQQTALTTEQTNILKKLQIAPPKPFVKLETAAEKHRHTMNWSLIVTSRIAHLFDNPFAYDCRTQVFIFFLFCSMNSYCGCTHRRNGLLRNQFLQDKDILLI